MENLENAELMLYAENENRVNKIHIIVSSAILLIGDLFALVAKLLMHDNTFSYMVLVYVTGSGLVFLGYPIYLMFKNPYHKAIKYLMTFCEIIVIAIVNLTMGRANPDTFLNFFWGICLSVLYFNPLVTAVYGTGSLFAYASLMFFVPELHPQVAGATSVVIKRGMYMLFVALAGVAAAVIANQLMRRLGQKERQNKESLVKIEKLLQEIGQSSQSLSTSSQQLSASAEEMSAQTEELNASFATVSNEAIQNQHEMEAAQEYLADFSEKTVEKSDLTQKTISMVESISQSALNGIDDSTAVKTAVHSFRSQFSKNTAVFDGLLQEINSVAKISQTLTSISKEINLLSLNASIEAARAGEFGKGFTVVATRVRKLAEETKQALDNVNEITKKIAGSIDSAETESRNAGEVLETTIQSINTMTEKFSAIVDELNSSIPLLKEVGAFLSSQSAMVNQVGTKITEATSFSKESTQTMTNLTEVVNGLAAMAQQIAASSEELAGLSETLASEAQ
ncbi:MAG TPA: methyl-accepting chemotaxis protein [Bacillota bacterium]